MKISRKRQIFDAVQLKDHTEDSIKEVIDFIKEQLPNAKISYYKFPFNNGYALDVNKMKLSILSGDWVLVYSEVYVGIIPSEVFNIGWDIL